MHQEVRFATVEDLDFIYDILREDLEEQGVLHRFKHSKKDFKNIIFGQKPLATFLTLYSDSKPVGFANYSIDYRNITVNLRANLYINDLFVKKPYRRRKGATLLMNKLKDIAVQERCGRIEFVVLANNESALKFYKNSFESKIVSDTLHYMRLELN